MANLNFVITVLCPRCSNFTEFPLSRFEVLTDGDYLGSCKNCDASIKILLKTPHPQLDTPCAECGHQKSAHWHRDTGGSYEFADCGGIFDNVCDCKIYRATT